MALLQTIQSDNGVPSTYWKIASVDFNLNGSCSIKIDGYFDEIARRDGYGAMKSFSYTVSSSNMSTTFPSGFNLASAYNCVKTQFEFSFGSVDVL